MVARRFHDWQGPVTWEHGRKVAELREKQLIVCGGGGREEDPGPNALSLCNNLMPKLGTEVALLPDPEPMGSDKVARVGCVAAHLP